MRVATADLRALLYCRCFSASRSRCFAFCLANTATAPRAATLLLRSAPARDAGRPCGRRSTEAGAAPLAGFSPAPLGASQYDAAYQLVLSVPDLGHCRRSELRRRRLFQRKQAWRSALSHRACRGRRLRGPAGCKTASATTRPHRNSGQAYKRQPSASSAQGRPLKPAVW